ncbi:MAG TPA: YfiR family protein [bacterium]|nr:YfiR family protein [bacterium]HPN42478.1 YfiR family protein [bacterium]
MKNYKIRHNFLKLITVIFLLLCTIVAGQEIYLPVKTQLQLFFKILTFDRNLRQRAGSELVFCVVYQAKFLSSYNIKSEVVEEFENVIAGMNDYNLKIMTVDLESENLEKAVIDKKIDILYIAPIRAFDLQKILQISRKYYILTTTGVPEYVQAGVTAGVTIKDNKPLILVNISSAKKENIDFSSQLLKLARIYD